MKYDVIIIGAGAAGLFCASRAGLRGRRVLVLEHAEKVGKKILISGGGRCNFTNLHTSAENYLSANPNFCKSALARFTPGDFLALVERYGIAWHEKKPGQLFCDNSARDIVHLLLSECQEAGVRIRVNCEVRQVSRRDGFVIFTSQGEFVADRLVVATGGLSIPKMGATDLGYRIARQFGLSIVAPQPGLVPLLLDEPDLVALQTLSGVSLAVKISCRSQSFQEKMLFTHNGLSGPAILQISSYWRTGEPVMIDLLAEQSAREILLANRHAGISLSSLLGQHMPHRFARAWAELMAALKPLRQYSDRELMVMAERLHHWSLVPRCTAGFGKAEVTRGGVDTRELSSQTMETRNVPGLYFIGEVVDVTGWLGGYNFQWAWASAFAAGQII